ncbi:hypothetical protein CHUAL_007659 [Chamberlinius hualienensis]
MIKPLICVIMLYLALTFLVSDANSNPLPEKLNDDIAKRNFFTDLVNQVKHVGDVAKDVEKTVEDVRKVGR